MVERAVATWKEVCLSRTFNGTELHVPLDDFGSFSPATQFSSSCRFAIPLMHTFRYFSGAVQDRADEPGGITLRRRFCAAAQMDTALRVTEGLAAEFAAGKRVPLLDEPTMAALYSLNRTLSSTSRLANVIREVLSLQCAQCFFLASHHVTENDPFYRTQHYLD